MSRPTQAVIKLQHLKDNYQLAKDVSQQAYAVIKADAYGHGLIQCAHALTEADGLAVACMDEALQLRSNGICHSILVLEGGYNVEEWDLALQHNIEMVIHHQSQLDILLTDTRFQKIELWLKVDTGMNRLGFRLSECEQVLYKCQQAGLNIRVLMTHFSCADDTANNKTLEQSKILSELLKQQKTIWPNLIISSNNSAAIIGSPSIHDDISRPGIMLYGSSPLIKQGSNKHQLKPVMTLSSEIIARHTVQPGETVGYGSSWVADKVTEVGIVAIGYGDGYPRSAPTGTPVWCQGKRLHTLGRVSMDMLCIDISNQSNIDVGSKVELWGENINANDVAETSNTISYELFCRLTPRVKRIYIN